MPGRHGGHGRLRQVVVAGAEDAAAAQHPRRGGAGRGGWRAGPGAGVPQPLGVPGEAAQRRRLQAQRAVDEVLGRPQRHRGWGVGDGVPGGWRRRAVQGLLQGWGVSRNSRLDLWRRWLPRWDCWRIVVRLGISLRCRGGKGGVRNGEHRIPEWVGLEGNLNPVPFLSVP